MLTDWTEAVFAALNTLRADPADPAALRELDGIRAAFNRHVRSRVLDDAAAQETGLILS